MVLDLEPLSAGDDFWLMDAPINPINAPSTLICPKINENPEEVLKKILQRIGRGHRCSIRMKKVFGKYFFEKLNEEEYKKWIKTNCAVRYDIKNDNDIIKLGLEMKTICEKDLEKCGIRIFYFPSLNNDTESGFMSVGHHTH